jgi:hypothetical protein
MPVIIPDQRSIPVAEQEKLTIKEKRDGCFEALRLLRYYNSMRIHNIPVIHDFRACVMDLYSFLKPKVKDHIQSLEKNPTVNADRIKDWRDLLEYMDTWEHKTYVITLKEMIVLLDYMNEFCEEYGITRTQVTSITSRDFV